MRSWQRRRRGQVGPVALEKGKGDLKVGSSMLTMLIRASWLVVLSTHWWHTITRHCVFELTHIEATRTFGVAHLWPDLHRDRVGFAPDVIISLEFREVKILADLFGFSAD